MKKIKKIIALVTAFAFLGGVMIMAAPASPAKASLLNNNGTGNTLSDYIVLSALFNGNGSNLFGNNGTYYIVQSGDTLTSISLRFYGTTAYVSQIAAANGIVNPSLIYTGERLFLPAMNGGTGALNNGFLFNNGNNNLANLIVLDDIFGNGNTANTNGNSNLSNLIVLSYLLNGNGGLYGNSNGLNSSFLGNGYGLNNNLGNLIILDYLFGNNNLLNNNNNGANSNAATPGY